MTKHTAGYDPKVPAPSKGDKPNTIKTKGKGLKVVAGATALGAVTVTEDDAYSDKASTVSAPKAPSPQPDHRPETPTPHRYPDAE